MKPFGALALAALAVASLADSAGAQYPPYGYYAPSMQYPQQAYYPGYPYPAAASYYRPPNPYPAGPYVNYQPQAHQPQAYRAPAGPVYVSRTGNPFRFTGKQGYPVWNSQQATPVLRTNVPSSGPASTSAQVITEEGRQVIMDSSVVAQPMPSTGTETLGTPTKVIVSPHVSYGEIIPEYMDTPIYEGEGDCPVPCGDPILSGRGEARGGFIVIGGVTVSQPRWQNNTAILTATGGPPVGAGPSLFGQQEFSYDLSFSPNAYAGFTFANGFGVRGHWWWFDDAANANAVAAPNFGLNSAAPLGLNFAVLTPGNALQAQSILQMNVIDGEAISQWQAGRWSLLLGGGARYAKITQRYNAWEIAPVVGNVTTLTSVSRHEGVGPTLVGEISRRLGAFGLGLYGMGRGSLLFTNFSQEGSLSTLAGGLVNQGNFRIEDVLPVGEFEVGMDFYQALGRLRLFARLGFLSQVWFGAGNSSNSNPVWTGFGPPGPFGPGAPVVDANAQSRNNMTLLGLNFVTGFQF